MRRFSQLFWMFAFCVAITSFAQITNVTGDQSAPIPGAGHDYIHMMNETVNPANGSVSIRIGVPVPPSRGVTIPFAFEYDSTAALHWTPNGWKDNVGNLAQGGWSYAVPRLLMQRVDQIIPQGQQPPIHCVYYTDYVFSDVEGGAHALSLSVAQQSTGTGPGSCTYGVNINGFGASFTPQDYLAGGDAQVQAATLPILGNLPNAVTVADMNGLVYHFPPASGLGSTSYGALPDWIEDRNGNKASISGSGSITDSIGRTAVSSSGFGPANGVMTNNILVSGITNPYIVTWANTTYPTPNVSSQLSYLPAHAGTGTCLASSSVPSPPVVTNITLPNGQSYQFQYDPSSGLVNKLIYPTGGYVSYTWAPTGVFQEYAVYPDSADYQQRADCEYRYDKLALQHRYVSYDGSTIAERQDFTYSSTWVTDPNTGIQSWSQKVTTVVTNDLLRGTAFQTVYTYSPFGIATAPNDNTNLGSQSTPVESQVAKYDTSGALLQTTSKGYTDPSLPPTETIAWPNGLTSKTVRNYSSLWYSLWNPVWSNFSQVLNYGMTSAPITSSPCYRFVPCLAVLSSTQSYDYGSGAPGSILAETDFNYATFGASPLFPNFPQTYPPALNTVADIVERPSQVITKDGGGTRVAETDYSYDIYSGNPISPATASQHDDTNYSASAALRGNATSSTVLCLLANGQSCSTPSLTTIFTYDVAGQTVAKTDPRTNLTQYKYSDNYDSPPGTNTDCYLTEIDYPAISGVSQKETFKYAYSDGQVIQNIDRNSQQTNYLYNDSLRRLTEVDFPIGSKTFNYHADALPATVTQTQTASPDPNIVTSTIYDGVGRVAHTTVDSDPDTTVTVDYTYDGVGLLWKKSNPHRSGTSTTDGTTQFTYDSLGRTTGIIRQDGNVVSTSYSANCATVTDEALRSRTACSDALGRVTSVVEPNYSTGSLTTGAYYTYYGYNTLGKLISVNQQADGSLAARNRTFSYDSLSRMVSAANPEDGTVSYTYDSASDCSSPNSFAGLLVKRVDARGVRTCYQYDALDRVTAKNYTDGTSAVAYLYDQALYNGLTITYGVGRRTGMSDGTGQTAWSYDPMGNVLFKRQTINGVTNAISHTFNQNNAVHTLISPNGHTYVYAYNGSGQPLSLSDSGSGVTYAQNAHYAPPGELTSATHGLNLAITENNSFNNRLQPVTLSVSSPSIPYIMSFTYSYDQGGGVNNGNVMQITNNRDITRSTIYTYDKLNRLSSAGTSNTTTWGDAYVYDPFGNLLQENVTQGTAESLQVNVDAGNHINTGGWTYDAAGNMTWEAGLQNALKYDAENRLNPVTGYVYSYDGDDRRVEKNNSGSITYFWYDSDGKVISTTGALVRDYAYFNGRRLAYFAPSSGNQHYYWSDDLGSASVMSNASGDTIEWEADYRPFGTATVINNYLENYFRFTDYQWDPEMGYYYAGAREQGPNVARFFSPDPIGISRQKVLDPQQWNMYSYARNNPLRFADPTGMYTANCGADVRNCQKQIHNFDTALQNALRSKKSSIRQAAQAYGKLGDKNGVNVTILKVVDSKHPTVTGTTTAQSGTSGFTYDEKTNTFEQSTQVNIRADMGGDELESTAIHEGVHVEDRKAYIDSIRLTPSNTNPSLTSDLSLDITARQSERNAYGVENEFLQSIGRPARDINDILAHPAYSDNPHLDDPLFPQ